MSAEEIGTLLIFIESIYGKNCLPSQTKTTIEAWQMILGDLDYKDAQLALVALASENRNFPPNPGQIRAKLVAIKYNWISSDEAFSLIREAVHKYGTYQEGDAEVWLGKEIWQMVRRYTWSFFCEMPRDRITTYTAQFRHAWEGEEEKKLSYFLLPENIKKRIEEMRFKQKLPPCLLDSGIKEHDFCREWNE